MPIVALYNTRGEQVGEVVLADSVFGVEVNEAVMHQAVLTFLANRRLGTAATKTRAEVRGGGRKPWRQKGTGRARHGSIRSPIWKGGGVVFGPQPRSYRMSLPRKVRKLALKSALTSKTCSGSLILLDQLIMESPKTKEMAGIFKNLKTGRKVLLVLDGPQENIIKSARNIPGVKTLNAGQLNVYDILNSENLVMTRDAAARLEEVYA
ncbi:MAG: 50S ribosomal protein L4 [Syntrophomonadaceae bacterium]|nr:50S ribosomal protein L4 [Bacillota bacterium]